jgi:hypothetical protein
MMGRMVLAATASAAGVAFAQPNAEPFCADLSHIVRLAGTAERFASCA